MDDAIKRVVVADLRQRGFSGSLPHLRRADSDRISLVSFQHFSSGGSFVVEVGACPPDGHTTSWGEKIAPSKVRAVDINNPRPRLGTPNFPGPGDHWFRYGLRSYERGGQAIQASTHYDDVARAVVDLLDSQAEPFWHAFPA